MRAVLRPLLLLLISLTVLLAIVTTSGRVLVLFLPQLESQINTFLLHRGIEVTGLRGRWHLLNPVIEVEHVRFEGGHVGGMTLEVDVLESALHSALIARHLSAEIVEVTPVRDVEGHWSLGSGARAAGGGFGPTDFLRYSDGLRFPLVQIHFAAGSRDMVTSLGDVRASVVVANAGSRHSGEVVVDVEHGGSGEIRLAYDLEDALFGRPASGRIALDAEHFVLEPLFGLAVGGVGVQVDQLHGQWSFSKDSSAGKLTLAARDLTLPSGALDSVDAVVRGSVDRLGRRWEFVADRLGAQSRHGAARLDDTVVAVTVGLGGATTVEAAMPSFDAGPVVGVVRDAAVNVRGVDEWLGGLAPRGRVDGAQARLDVGKGELAYVARVSELALEDFKGVPQIRNGRASVAGTEHSLQIRVNGEQMDLGLLSYIDQPIRFEHLEGDVLVWFVPGHLVVRGKGLAGTFGASTLRSQFSFARPTDPLEQRLLLTLRINDIDAREALHYVPRELPQALLHGLDQAVVGGHVDGLDLVYHGHVRTIEGLPMRQAELRVRLHDGVVRFHPDWPVVTGVAGQVVYTSTGTTGRFDAGILQGIALRNATVLLPPSQDFVTYEGDGAGDGNALRRLIDASPLSKWLTFVKPEWTFSGPFDYTAHLKIPIRSTSAADVDLQLDLKELTAQLADMKLELGSLRGKLHYRYPAQLDADVIKGSLFGRPAEYAVRTESGQVRIAFKGHAAVHELTDWRALPNPGLADGELDFTGDYRIRPGSNEAPVLAVKSDLVGVALALPAELGKAALEPRPSTLRITFANPANRLDVQLGNVAQAWLRMDTNGVRGGSVGIGVDAATERGDEDAVTIDGSLAQIDLTGRLRADEVTIHPGFAWGMNAFKIGRVTYQNIGFDDVVADIWSRAGDLQISVTGPDVEGSIAWSDTAPPKLDLHYLKLPARQIETEPVEHNDPLAHVDPQSIGDFDVAVQSVMLGEEDFGSWQFELRRSEQGVAINHLVADLKGLHIESPADTLWSNADSARTRFKGQLHAGDLATVLPQWGYASSLETTSADVETDIGWPGSPVNFALSDLVGRFSVKAKDGRFVDVSEGSGAVRIVSLLNFTAIAKRMALDFSDVFGKGISFDTITADVAADQGTIMFVAPLVIEGTGGEYRNHWLGQPAGRYARQRNGRHVAGQLEFAVVCGVSGFHQSTRGGRRPRRRTDLSQCDR